MNLSPTKVELVSYIFQIINESADPEKAIATMMDIISRIIAGEDPASIEARYKPEIEEIRSKIRDLKHRSKLLPNDARYR